jgi:hypothetical protein
MMADLDGALLTDIVNPEGVTLNPAQKTFIGQAIDWSAKGNVQPRTPAGGGMGSAVGLSADDLAKAIDKRRKPVVQHIDMQPMLKASTLEGLAHEVLPRSREVDELGFELKRLKDSGVGSPFPFVELKRFMPPWIVSQPDPSKIVPFAIWAAAYQRWSIAMVCLGCAKQTSCAAHFDNCLRTGTEAAAAGRSALMTQVYDEVVRKKLAELAHAGLTGFNVDTALQAFDKDAVRKGIVDSPLVPIPFFVSIGSPC